MKRKLGWLAGTVAVLTILGLILFGRVSILFNKELPHVAFFTRSFLLLLLCAALCVLRILLGPTAPDRAVALDILGILVVGVCALLGIPTGRGWYMDIAIAWGLQSFIATLALAKYLEGKGFDQ